MDTNDVRAMLMSLLTLVKNTTQMAADFGTEEEQQMVQQAGQRICQYMQTDAEVQEGDREQCYEYLSQITAMRRKYRKQAEAANFEVYLKYTETKNPDTDAGFSTGSAELQLENGAGPNQLLNMFLALRIKLEEHHPELMAAALAPLQVLPGIEGAKVSSLHELKDILRKHVHKCKETHKDIQNDALAKLWKYVLEVYDRLEEPDDLDSSILKKISNIVEELGDDPTADQLANSGVHALLNILEKNN